MSTQSRRCEFEKEITNVSHMLEYVRQEKQMKHM